MKIKYISIFLFLFLINFINAQNFPIPDRAFFGKVNFSNASAGGTADVVTDLVNFNDQTIQNHLINEVQIGDVIFDQSGNIWEVAVVNSTTIFSANVDLYKILGNGPVPFGNGNIARPTTNLKLIPVSTVNSLGISEKLQAEISNYNNWKIDAINTIGSQVISYNPTTNILSLSNGGSVDLSGLLDNTDAQDLSYDSGTQELSLVDGGTVDLSSLLDDTDDQSALEVKYDNSTSGLTAINTQVAIDELAAREILYYDAGEGFWVKGTVGISVSSGSAGEYKMNIPVGSELEFYYKNFKAGDIASELDTSGNFTLTMNWNEANTSWDDVFLPSIVGYVNGQQYYLGATGQTSITGINIQHSLPSGGNYTSTFTGVSGSIGGTSTQIKGSF